MKKAFTIVELIIVISILAILSSIWYMSYLKHIVTVKDNNRINQIHNIWDGIDLQLSKWKYIQPENAIDVYVDWRKYSTQWQAWEEVLLESLFIWKGIDPKDNEYYTFSLASNNKDYQIMSFLESKSNIPKILKEINKFWTRFPYVYGKYSIWILLDDFWTPLNKVLTWTVNIDCNVDLWYKMIFQDWRILDWIVNQSEFENWPCYIKPANWCATTPTYVNADYNIWTPNTSNQEWVKWDISEPCSYTCTNWYTGINCEVLPWVALAGGNSNWWYNEWNLTNNSTKKLWIYYWYPSSLNETKNDYHLDMIVDDFNEFNSIILWEWLEEISHPDNLNTNYILDWVWPWVLWYAPSGFSWYNWESYGYVSLMNTSWSINTSIILKIFCFLSINRYNKLVY